MAKDKLRAETEKKLKLLHGDLSGFDSLLVCYSGGTDSSLLLAVAKEQLKEKVEGVLFRSVITPRKLLVEARKQAADMGVNLHIIDVDTLANAALINNPENRCYKCKQDMLTRALTFAKVLKISAVAEGSQADDLKKYRPGRLAVKELGVHSPLEKAGLNKQEIREISRIMHLPTWLKSSYSCLMTRFPHGERITTEKLRKIEDAEEFLSQLGFKQFKVKDHGEVARLELGVNETVAALGQYKNMIIEYFKNVDYKHVTADIEEYEGGTPSRGTRLF